MTKAKKDYNCDVCAEKIASGDDYYRSDTKPWNDIDRDYDTTFRSYHVHNECIGILSDFLEMPDEGYDDKDISEAKHNADAVLFDDEEYGKEHSWKELREKYKEWKALPKPKRENK